MRKKVFQETAPDDPMIYFYGIHYSQASCGLSRYPAIPTHNDILVPLFCQCLSDRTCPARSEIAKELGWAGDARAVPALIRVLDDPTAPNAGFLLSHAAEALGMLKDARAVNPLYRAIQRGLVDTQGLQALAFIGTDAAIAYLVNIMNQGLVFHPEKAAEVLGWITPPDKVRPYLLKAFHEHPDPAVRVCCASSLMRAGWDEDLFDYLVRHLHDPSPHIRRVAAMCIVWGPPYPRHARTIPLMIQILRDGSEGSDYAWEALCGMFDDDTRITPSIDDRQKLADQYEAAWKQMERDREE